MVQTLYNPTMVDPLSGPVQRRYEPGFAWSSVVAAHLALPALRALWPMAPVDFQRPEATDASGHGYDLQSAAALGGVTFSYDTAHLPVPIAVFGGGANQYLSRADGGVSNWADIGTGAGSDLAIRAAERGLTLGGWFWWSALPGAWQYLMAKDDVGANRQYYLALNAGNTISMGVWPGPVGVASTNAIVAGWNHVVGNYDQPSQTLYLVVNDIVTPGVLGAAPAALADTAAAFTVGADGAGATRFAGYASMCFLEACSLRQGGLATTVRSLFHTSRAMFGV